KSCGSFNSRAAKIEEMRERLGIKKPIIVPKSREKIIHDKINKNSYNIAVGKDDFRKRLKSKLKKDTFNVDECIKNS
ncbi:relaxase, partial [Klebsiella pneumoniae]|nr:relaxase [Klebsiella pneumoniae]